MIDPIVRFPVVCPKCGSEKLAEFPVGEVAHAISMGLDLSLVATCHDMIWTATELELEQIHQYLRVLTEAASLDRPFTCATTAVRRPHF
jgi:hypothetical protein